jgi:hypothetical protein
MKSFIFMWQIAGVAGMVFLLVLGMNALIDVLTSTWGFIIFMSLLMGFAIYFRIKTKP